MMPSTAPVVLPAAASTAGLAAATTAGDLVTELAGGASSVVSERCGSLAPMNRPR